MSAERRQMEVGWLGQVDEEALSALVWEWLEGQGALDMWIGCGPDKNPEDWELGASSEVRGEGT